MSACGRGMTIIHNKNYYIDYAGNVVRKSLSNCWFVAMWFWLKFKAKHPVGIRRSRYFWFIPHFITTIPGTYRRFYAVEYIPPKHKRWTKDDFVLLFRGRYRLTEYRVVSIKWFNTKDSLINWHKNNTRIEK